MTDTVIRTLVVANAVQAAIFDKVIRHELSGKLNTKWANETQAKLAEPFKLAKVVVAAEGQATGRDFDAQKTNFNINDSNWVNQEDVTKKLISVAGKAAGKPMTKKEVVAELVALKGIFGNKIESVQAAA